MTEKSTNIVLKAMGIFGGVQAVTILSTLIRTKAIAVWIGPVGVGLFAIFNNVVDLLSQTTQLNMRQSSVRDISDANREQANRVGSAVVWWSRVLGIAGTLFMALLSPLLSKASFGDYGHWWMFAILSVVLLFQSLSSGQQAIMQGFRHLKELAKSSLYGSVIATVISLPLFYFFGVKSIIPVIILFGVSICACSYHYQRGQFERLPWRESMSIGRGFLKFGLYITVSSLFTIGASYAFVSYLNQTASTSETGLYQAGYTLIVKYLGLIFAALAMEYYPRISKLGKRGKLVSTAVSHEMSLLMCVIVPVIVMFVTCEELIVRLLYTEEFMAMLPMIHIGIWGAVFRVTSYCMSFVILARGDGKAFMTTEILSAIIGLALNISFYRAWGLGGLGWSYVLWYAIYTVIVGIVYFYRFGLSINLKAVMLCACGIAITGLAILLRTVGWWASVLMLVPSALLIVMARRPNKKLF